ncbi:MAG: sensor domain-containing diguanylate cyclase [Desulfobacteraceae bacterium]|nr:MAG: sensor domain-containing diguanylate cyclase [Desulfobacteraceae bacterium]
MSLSITTLKNKRTIAGILRFALMVVYLSATAGSIWLCNDFSPGYLFDRIVPYGIPPLLTLLSAAFLSLFVLSLEQTRTETLLFSIICLVFAGLNLDIFLLGIIRDPHTALIISRMDHFMLALVQLGANLHLAYLVCEKKNAWWIVYGAYGAGVIMALFTPTNLYFQGVYTYYWGFFAKKAILYDVMSMLWLVGTIYGIVILSFSYRESADIHKKDTIKFILLGFVCSAALSLTNTPAMYGHEVYPLGTFTFISLFLLAYGLFKYNLRIALQQLRTVIFVVGHLSMVAGIAFASTRLLPRHAIQWKPALGILMAMLLYHPVFRLWDALLNLLIKRSDTVLQKELYTLTSRLSELHRLADIHREMCRWLFRIFINSRCAMIFENRENNVFTGWNTWNSEPFSGFFKSPPETSAGETPLSIDANHPILKLIIETRPGLINRETIDQWTSEHKFPLDPDDSFLLAAIIIPVFSRHRMIGLLLIGNRHNDRSYSKPEKNILAHIGVVLGPVIEKANLLEELERKVEKRTRDLFEALKKVKENNQKISVNNATIKKQNHMFLTLFETSTSIHEIEEMHELFAFTLNQLRLLFPHLGFGIIHHGERAEILESGAFIGISEKEKNAILKNHQYLTEANINQIINEDPISSDAAPANRLSCWTIQPMQIRNNHIIGKIIIKGPQLDQISSRVISIFLAQVSASVHNKALMQKLETSAHTDGLTGVANRSFLDKELEKAIRNSTLFPEINFSILIIDINGLKRINDNFGHDKGDEMIQMVARTLAVICRETDTLCRMGGDEFIILLPAITSVQAAAVVLRIREQENRLVLTCRQPDGAQAAIPVRFSLGLAGSDETGPDKVMKLADQRMYADKERFYQTAVESIHTRHR